MGETMGVWGSIHLMTERITHRGIITLVDGWLALCGNEGRVQTSSPLVMIRNVVDTSHIHHSVGRMCVCERLAASSPNNPADRSTVLL